MSITAKFAALNDADLSKLSGRIADLKKQLEQDLRARGDDPNRPITAADLQAASAETGLDLDTLLEALETARRVT